MKEGQTAKAFSVMKSCRATITFYWICPMCQTKVFGVAPEGETSSAYQCHICRNLTKVLVSCDCIQNPERRIK